MTAPAHHHTPQVQPTTAPPTATLPTACDIAILGAGPVGSALALQLAACWPDPSQIVLIDSKPWPSTNTDNHASSNTQTDPRTLALAAGSVDLLNRLGAWTTLAPHTQAITHIHVSRRGQFGRTLMTAAEHRVPALGYVARYNALLNALENKLQQQRQTANSIQVLRPFRVLAAQADGQINLENPAGESHTLQAHCIIHAEGGLFGQPTSIEATQATVTHDSGQTALLTTVRAQHPQAGYAYERFCDHGPLALLPNGVGTYAVVWCGQAATLQALTQADAPTFNAALAQTFGTRLGQFERVSPCNLYPLGLRVQREVVVGRRVILGNAAQTLHPVAGQGLNLGLRDSQTLVQLLHQYGPQQLDQALAQYRQQRRVDRWGTIGLTELMSQAFTWPIASGVAAGLLGLLDMLPSARRSLARRMMFGHR